MFSSSDSATEDREYIDLKAALNKLLIVRPLEYKQDFKTQFSPEGTDVVFCDIAVVDDVDQATGQQGKVYRSQAILQGFLKGAFKRKIGEMILGMVYLGPPQKGRPPFMWHDLYGDPNAVARATTWVQQNQSFLVQLSPSAAEPSGPPTYVAPATGGLVAPGALTKIGESGPPAHTVPAAKPPMTTLEQMRNMTLGGGDSTIDAPF